MCSHLTILDLFKISNYMNRSSACTLSLFLQMANKGTGQQNIGKETERKDAKIPSKVEKYE